MLRNKFKHLESFTLIELLVVIAIIGILSGVIIMSTSNATNSANDAKRKANLDTIRKALLMYQANNGGTYPISTTPCNIKLSSGCSFPASFWALLPNPPTDPTSTTTYYKYTSADGANFTVSITASSSQAINSQYGTGIADIDGNFYNTVVIGTQTWMKENLMTATYPDGTPITRGPSGSWDGLDHSYYSYPPNTSNTDDADLNTDIKTNKLGFAYQWSAAMNGSTIESAQGVCPIGWHIPSNTEWNILEQYVIQKIASPNPQYDCNPGTNWKRCADTNTPSL